MNRLELEWIEVGRPFRLDLRAHARNGPKASHTEIHAGMISTGMLISSGSSRKPFVQNMNRTDEASPGNKADTGACVPSDDSCVYARQRVPSTSIRSMVSRTVVRTTPGLPGEA